MLWSISGGAGFLGLHLARRLLADGHDVRTLDVVPLDDAELERSVEELRGDVRDSGNVRRLVAGADVESKIDAEGLCRVAAVETTIVRPKTFVGPERLGVFEILFDWIREGRRIYTLGKGDNRYQLLAVEDLVDAIVRAATADVAGEVFNVGATEFGTVRSDMEAL